MDLADGVAEEQGVAALASCLASLDTTRTRVEVAGGQGQVETARDLYLMWVEDAEHLLSGLSRGDVWLLGFFTPRYSDLRDLHAGSARPVPLILGEATFQRNRLQGLAADLADAQVADGADLGATRAVLDTNVWLHFEVFDSDWCSLLSVDAVRLLVPLVVLRELDQHKNRGGSVEARRARSVTRRLLQETDDGRARGSGLPGRVTVEIFQDAKSHTPHEHKDREFLDSADRLTRRPGGLVMVVSDDGGVHAASQAHGLTVVRPPEDWRLPDVDPTVRENAQLRKELDALQNARPQIRVAFAGSGDTNVSPPSYVRPASCVAEEVAQAEQDLPEEERHRATVQTAIYSISNATRRGWYEEVRVWAQEKDRLAARGHGGVRLDLATVNIGGAAASDCKITLRVPEEYIFLSETALDAGPRPEQPQPGGLLLPAPIADWSEPFWEVEPDHAWAHLRVIRQGGRLQGFDEPVFLVRRDGRVLAEGVAVSWEVVSVTPAYASRGDLHIKPRPTT